MNNGHFCHFEDGPLLTQRHYSSAIRPEISAAERLSMGLRCLAAGNSQVNLTGVSVTIVNITPLHFRHHCDSSSAWASPQCATL